MKAVILAGGEGKRLKCITGERPKPLVPLLGRSVMEHILLLLRRCGFREVCAALGYRAEEVAAAFPEGSIPGLSLCFRTEEKALGTAGAVKNCEDFYGEEDFLLISGDAVCDFDLAALFRRHRESGAAVTIALKREALPLRFGLAVTDAAGEIRSFIEKPDWSRVVSDRINTGIYVLSPRAMRLVPRGEVCDFARDLFPELLRRGERILGVEQEGYWRDIGTPLDYYRCCVDALEGRLRIDAASGFLPAQSAPQAAADERAAAVLDFSCRDRAATMGALSSLMLELGADFSDGIRLSLPRARVHIYPRGEKSAVAVAADSPDAEFASSLALSAGEIIRALDL